MAGKTRVYLEAGSKRTFAMALDWPGWGRSGKNADEALRRLADYGPRYAVVTERADVTFAVSVADQLEVVETVRGNTTTDFGAPDGHARLDREPLPAKEARRLAALVGAAWDVFDQVAAGSPEELRKGPRGGGRDRDKMIDHVIGAEAMYARKIGVRHKPPALGDRAAIEALRKDVVAAIEAGDDDSHGWPVRYAARRIAWHVLDHAWEMEDRRL